jgi:methionyl aminopeptidase
MREAGRIVAGCLDLMEKHMRSGVTTAELDRLAEEFIRSRDAKPTFKGYRGYRASICASINEEVVHGIPSSERRLEEGDIIGIDVGATYKNYVGDAARTFPVGRISPAAQRLIDTCRESLDRAIAAMAPGVWLLDVSRTVQEYAESRGYSVVKKFVGHGVGQKMHEDPQVPNYVPSEREGFEVLLKPGMVLAIEPMLNEGTDEIRVLKDKWTVVTADGKLSAHWEHSVAVVPGGREVLTRP